ncbi:MAG: MFS transporter, partial [Bacillota bacterium]
MFLEKRSDFHKLWAGQTVSVFGSMVGRFAMPLVAIYVLGANARAMGLLNAAEIAPGVAISLFAGLLADRVRRRPTMIAVDLVRAVLLATIPLAVLAHRLSMGHLYVVGLAISALTVLFDVTYQSYVPSLVPTGELVRANSRLQATASLAEVTGFSLAGVLVQILTAPLAILVDAVSFVVSAVSLALIRTPERTPSAAAAADSTDPGAPASPPSRAWADIQAGVRSLWANPVLRTLVTAGGLLELFSGVFGALIMLFVSKDLGLTPALMGVVFSVGGATSLLGALLAQPVVRRLGLGRTLVATAAVWAVAALAVPLAHGSLVMVSAFLVAQQF